MSGVILETVERLYNYTVKQEYSSYKEEESGRDSAWKNMTRFLCETGNRWGVTG